MTQGPQPVRAAVLAGASLAIGLWSNRGRGAKTDSEAFHAVNGAHSPTRDSFFSGVTELGSIVAPAAAAGVLFIVGERRAAVRAASAAAVTWGIGQAVKKAFARPRPYDAHPSTARRLIGRPRGTSWPSSHPAVLVSFTTVAARELDLSAPVRAGLLGLASTVAASRTYLGVHFPSDVAGGLLLGRAVGLAWPRVP